MTTIKLEIPTNDPSALFHMGEALRNIAKENGYIVQQRATVTSKEANAVVDELFEEVSAELQVPVTMLKGGREEAETPPTDTEQYGKSLTDSINDLAESIGIVRQQASEATVEIANEREDELLSPHTTVVEHEASDELIDSKGLPWDKRIHSRGKTRLADDSWRMARKPADKDDDEWAAYVEEVETELRALMDIPVTVEYSPSDEGYPQITVTPPIADVEPVTPPIADVEPVTPPIADVEPVTPPVADVEPVTPPVADVEPVTPPVADVEPVTPPVVTETVTSDVPTTFPLFMKWLTTNNKKLTKEGIDAVLKSHGIASIALLMSRSDLIPQIHADLVKSL